LGALLQAAITYVWRSPFAPFPVLVVALLKGLNTLSITIGLKKNPYLDQVIPHRTCAQIPDEDGTISPSAANEKVTVFLLGFKVNHPLGILAPHISTINESNVRMWQELEATSPESGYFGSTEQTVRDPRGAVEIVTISYWRSMEDVHRFAYGPIHRKIWEYWNTHVKELAHLGIIHEMFEVDKHKWEAVYLNTQPTMLGATSFRRKGDKDMGGQVEDAWISSLVDARKGKLRTSAGRLGRDPDELARQYDGKALWEYGE
jgi:heme-degrading monooxygenase HmoA